MQLTYINASPRGKKGNTDKHMNNFIEGFSSVEGTQCDVYYLNHFRNTLDDLAAKFWHSENIVIGFPLYVDAIPGSLKAFMEVLGDTKEKTSISPNVFYMGQCGFPETHHMRFVERYLKKFTKRIGCNYLGSVMKGGGEGLHIQPPAFTDKTFKSLNELGKDFAQTSILNQDILSAISHPEHLTHEQIAGILPYVNTNLWDKWMEEHNALDKSFDRPYQK